MKKIIILGYFFSEKSKVKTRSHASTYVKVGFGISLASLGVCFSMCNKKQQN